MILENGRPLTKGENSIDDKLIDSLSEKARETVFDWIATRFRKVSYTNNKRSSYGLKHYLEEDTGIYLTNNQFKDAMLKAGFKPSDPNELNWHFAISERWFKNSHWNGRKLNPEEI